jgi:hypothetical protein
MENGAKLSAREIKEQSSVGVKESLWRRDLLSQPSDITDGTAKVGPLVWMHEQQK